MKKKKYTKDWNMSNEVREEKKKKISSGLAWTIFIAVIMVSSIIGYMWIGGNEAEFEYNGHKIARTDNGFAYAKDGNKFMFKFFPSELEGIKGNTSLSLLNRPMFYLTFDPESGIVESMDVLRFDFSSDLPKLNVYFQQGVLNRSSIYNFTVIDCINATANVPVVKFIESNETKVTEKDNCLIFEAKSNYDVIKLKDLMLYSLLGVI